MKPVAVNSSPDTLQSFQPDYAFLCQFPASREEGNSVRSHMPAQTSNGLADSVSEEAGLGQCQEMTGIISLNCYGKLRLEGQPLSNPY